MSDISDLTGEATPTPFGSSIKRLAVTASTNEDALRWAQEGAEEGAVVVAEQQTAGRGRRGRTWLSEPGHSLLMSIVLRPPLKILPLLSTAVGVGACEGVRVATHLSVLLKWPNDLVIDDRKIAGILVESRSSSGSELVAVAGIGLNLSWPGAGPPQEIAGSASSVGDEMQRDGLDDPPSADEMLSRLVTGIERRYRQLVRGDVADLVTTAESLSALVGREVVVRLPGGDATKGMVTGLATDGGLEVVTSSGQQVFTAGEVETVRRR